MADTLTSHLKLTDQQEGSNSNSWGGIVDQNWHRLDAVLGDLTEITTTGGDTTLTDTQELVAAIRVDGTLASNATIVFSGRGGFWIIENATEGDYTVTAKVSGQTGVLIEQGTTEVVWCDGTDIFPAHVSADVTPEVTVASAATTDVLGAGSEFIAISGTTTITSFGTGPNRKRFCRATGDFTLTHHATSLILPGAENIAVKTGDTFIVVSDASSNARVVSYLRATGRPVVIPPTPDLDAIEALEGTAGLLKKTGENTWALDELTTNIIFSKDTGNSNVPLNTGVLGELQVDFACTITGITLLADQTGSATVDIWVDSYANYPPTDADSITGPTPPSISNGVKANDTTLLGWTTAISAGDILRFNLDSVTSISRLTIKLKVKRFGS